MKIPNKDKEFIYPFHKSQLNCDLPDCTKNVEVKDDKGETAFEIIFLFAKTEHDAADQPLRDKQVS